MALFIRAFFTNQRSFKFPTFSMCRLCNSVPTDQLSTFTIILHMLWALSKCSVIIFYNLYAASAMERWYNITTRIWEDSEYGIVMRRQCYHVMCASWFVTDHQHISCKAKRRPYWWSKVWKDSQFLNTITCCHIYTCKAWNNSWPFSNFSTFAEQSLIAGQIYCMFSIEKPMIV